MGLEAKVKLTGDPKTGELGFYSRIFDLSAGPDRDSINAGMWGRNSTDLFFSVGRAETTGSVLCPGALKVGEEALYLFTVSDTGVMRIYKDSTLLGENNATG